MPEGSGEHLQNSESWGRGPCRINEDGAVCAPVGGAGGGSG